MNASQLTMIKEAKRLLEDCSCFRGPTGPPGSNGSTIVGPIGPTGPQGPAGTLSSFSLVGASTNALLYYDGFKPAGMSSLFYYSTLNILQANLDIVPCTDNIYSLGSSNQGRWKDLFLGPSSLYLGYKAKVYEDSLGNVTTDTGFHGYTVITSTMNIGNSVGYQFSVNNNDLFAQQYNSTGPNGTLYPLLHPIGYISTSQLTSSLVGLGTFGYISTSQLTSSIIGTQAIFVSTQSLLSTTQGIENSVLSTNTGLGALGYISSLQLISTVSGIDSNLIIIQNGLGQLGYLSTTQLISTVNGLGTLYVSTTQLTSTTIGLETAFTSTINMAFPSSITGLGTAGYISSSQLTSTVTGLGNIYLSSIPAILPNTTFGKVLRVDSVYGNDTTALQNQYSYPFSTISTAMYCASTQDQIWLLPGTYNEKVIFKSGVNMRGVNLNSVIIQQANVTQPTTLVSFTQSNRLEDVTLNLTSQTTVASTLIGVLFSSCQDTCKLRTIVLNVNNSAIIENTRPTYVYGIYSSGHSSTFYTTNDNIQRTSMTVTSAGNGKAWCIYNNDSNRFSARDVNLLCTDSLNATYTGGTYYGIETNDSNAIIQIKTSSVSGNAYNIANIANDISQTKGVIILAFTDLINKTANNNAFIANQPLNNINFSISGALSNFQYIGGPNGISNNWSNTFLFPGTQNYTTVTSDIVPIYNFLRIPNTNLIANFGIQAQRGTAAGISSFAVLYKNGFPVSTPNFVLPLVGASSFFLSTSTLTLKITDTYGIYISTSSSNTTLSNVTISMSLF